MSLEAHHRVAKIPPPSSVLLKNEERKHVEIPDELKDCTSLGANKQGPIIEVSEHSKKKKAKKIYRRSNHFNFKSLDLSHTPESSSKQSTPEFTTRKREESDKTPKSTFRTENTEKKAQKRSSKGEKKTHHRLGSSPEMKCPLPSSLLQLELSKVKQKGVQEPQQGVMSGESSISPSPSNSVIKVLKERRMKSIAEESATETITSLCVENNRLKEELFALEERYENEKGDFEMRFRTKEEHGTKEVRALEQQIRYLNSEL